MHDIKQKRKALLDETVAHFNSTNRSVENPNTSLAKCVYSGSGCAIGRKIEDKELCKKLDDMGFFSSVSSGIVFNLLPDHLKELGQNFLRALQNLHDDGFNWSKTGLSDRGYAQYYKILTEFCL